MQYLINVLLLDRFYFIDQNFNFQSKYFPRAAALFVQADPSIENWSSSQYDFLEAIVSRIVSVKGSMQACSICRSQWDVKATLIRTKIDRGIHLRLALF